ncbi:hypothetical protein KIJ00_00740 [Leuconostoc gelidum subsp. aenigmaticum]|uniref:hypothetical protein n=1 Tax=Leuconostoc gelidum TaxID=1244 RepID=UPI001CC3EB09|nr:hypothetical protein [Leuconostoc gelidum]MBZ6007791.1 hypothetical protein [Leuconostoc gelidum subsp. aenigmaticum]
MGLINKFNELNSNRKRNKRFENYNTFVRKQNNTSLSELSEKTGISLDKIEEDVKPYIDRLNEQEQLFKNRYYFDTSKGILYRKSFSESIKEIKSFKLSVYAVPILIVVFVFGIFFSINNDSEQQDTSKNTSIVHKSSKENSSSTSNKQTSSSSVSSSSTSELSKASSKKVKATDILTIIKRKNDLKVDSNNGGYIGKSTSPESISFKGSDTKMTDGLYRVKWGHGIWWGSDPDYAYALIIINGDSDNQIQITEDDPQNLQIKSSDIIHVRMFGKGTGDTLKFSK